MNIPETNSQTRRSAMELALHRLTHQTPPTTYEESFYGTLQRLCPAGFDDMVALIAHFADAMAAGVERECGGREAAVESLRQQLAETDGPVPS